MAEGNPEASRDRAAVGDFLRLLQKVAAREQGADAQAPKFPEPTHGVAEHSNPNGGDASNWRLKIYDSNT